MFTTMAKVEFLQAGYFSFTSSLPAFPSTSVKPTAAAGSIRVSIPFFCSELQPFAHQTQSLFNYEFARFSWVRQRPEGNPHREKRGSQAGYASCSSHSASIFQGNNGDELGDSEHKEKELGQGKLADALSEPRKAARVGADARKAIGHECSHPACCEGRAGRESPRQEVFPEPTQVSGIMTKTIHATLMRVDPHSIRVTSVNLNFPVWITQQKERKEHHVQAL
jgi:hypothetical protein